MRHDMTMRARRCAHALLVATLVLSCHGSAPAAPKAHEEKHDAQARLEKTQEDKSLLDLYLVGGWLMHPIAACSLGTVAIGIHAYMLTTRRRLASPQILPHLCHSVGHGRIQEAYDMCCQHPGLVTDALGAALLKTDSAVNADGRAAMEQSAADSLAHEETRCMYWINYLNVFATVAPMLGLLGTVTGMIQAFDTLAAGHTEPQDLAGGISEAMITTAGGLIVGIPAMLLYLLYRNNLQSAVTEAQRAIAAMLDSLVADAGPDADADEPHPGPAAT